MIVGSSRTLLWGHPALWWHGHPARGHPETKCGRAVGTHATLGAVGGGLGAKPPTKLKCFAMVWWNAAQAKTQQKNQLWPLYHQATTGMQWHSKLRLVHSNKRRRNTDTTTAVSNVASTRETLRTTGNPVNPGA